MAVPYDCVNKKGCKSNTHSPIINNPNTSKYDKLTTYPEAAAGFEWASGIFLKKLFFFSFQVYFGRLSSL